MFLSILFTHRKSPVRVRENIFKLWNEKINLKNPFIQEKVLLVTCYRVELYLVVEQNKKDMVIKEFLPESHLKYAQILSSPMLSFEHLALVASGADSPAIGEPEVQGQVKKAYFEAKKKGWVGRYMTKFFEKALSVAKKIREEAEFQKGSLSIPRLVSIYLKELNEKKEFKVLLIGTGEMGIAISKYLFHENIPFVIATKSRERADFLKKHANLETIVYKDKVLSSLIKNFEAVIFATQCKKPLIYPKDLKKGENPKIIIDLGFPENVSRDIKKCNWVIYHGIDDFKKVIEERIKEKEGILSYARFTAKNEATKFEQWIEKEEKIKKFLEFTDKKINQIVSQNGKDSQSSIEKIKRFFLYPTLKSIRSGKSVEEIIEKWLKE